MWLPDDNGFAERNGLVHEGNGWGPEGRQETISPPPPHTHSIHNRMLHLIQDVQKDASLQWAAGGEGVPWSSHPYK